MTGEDDVPDWDGRSPEEMTAIERSRAESDPKYQRKHMSPEERRDRAISMWLMREASKVQRERRAAGEGKSCVVDIDIEPDSWIAVMLAKYRPVDEDGFPLKRSVPS